jgi:hypothetical protein
MWNCCLGGIVAWRKGRLLEVNKTVIDFLAFINLIAML